MEAQTNKPSTAIVDAVASPPKSKGKQILEEFRKGMGLPSQEDIDRRIAEGKKAFEAHANEKKRDTRFIPISQLRPSPTNPRKTFVKLEELGASLVANGCVQALVVRPWVDASTGVVDPKCYEIVCGERRYRAAKLKKIEQLPCDVREDLPDSVVADMQVAENLQRNGLTPIEEAESFDALIKRFHMTAEQVAQKHGVSDGEKISASTVRARVKLLALGPEARLAIAEGWLPHSVGTVLARSCPTHALQAKWLKENKRKHYNSDEIQVIEARWAIENLQREFTHNLNKAPFNMKDEDLVPLDTETGAGGSCLKCPHNAANLERGLFEDLGSKPGNICTLITCYTAKTNAAVKLKVEQLEAKGVEVLKGEAATKARAYNSGLSKLTEANYNHPKNAKWGELLEKLPVDERPEVVAIVESDGSVAELVDTKAITKAIAKTSGAKWAKGDAESAEKRKKEREQSKKKEAEQVKRRQIAGAICAAIGRAAKSPELELWRMIGSKLLEAMYLSEDQVEALGFAFKGDPTDGLMELIDKKGTLEQVRAAVIAIAVMDSDVAHDFEYRDDDKALRALGKRLGVKVDDIVKSVENAQKAEEVMTAGKGKAKKS